MWLVDFAFRLIYFALDIVTNVAFAACICGVACCVWNALSKRMSFFECANMLDSLVDTLIGNFRMPILIVALLGVFFTSAAIHQLLGVHNLELKPEGTYCFYVEAHREGGKTYTLPAEVEVVKETFGTGEAGSRTHTCYYIKSVFFSNGGWLDTDDGESDDIGEPSAFFDDDSEWELTLLNEHAYSSRVNETNNADWLDITFLLIKLSSVTVFLYTAYRNRTHSTKGGVT